MRRRFIQIPGGELVEFDQYTREPVAPMVMPDIAEYTSMIDGSRITSRSKHREHLRDHGMVEIGNDSSLHAPRKPIESPDKQQLREILRAQVNDMTNEQWKAAGRRDLERLRWQTNGIPDPLKEI